MNLFQGCETVDRQKKKKRKPKQFVVIAILNKIENDNKQRKSSCLFCECISFIFLLNHRVHTKEIVNYFHLMVILTPN